MQLELSPCAAPQAGPRVVALHFPDLSLQRVLRSRAPADGARAPLAIERDGVVAACEVEARARGVRPGDPLVQARAACADLDVVPIDDEADRAELEAMAEALLALAPAVEIAASGTLLLLDASSARLLAPGLDGERLLASRAVALAADLGLRARSAVASGRGPASALARHGGATEPVAAEATAAALSALPLSALALPEPLAARLAAVGLRAVGDLARLPGASLPHRFGVEGVAAWRLALGDDPTPLVPFTPCALPQERIDLEAPAEAAEPLLFALKRLCDRLAARLAGRELGATRLALALRLDPRGEERLELALARPSSAAARWMLVLRERLGELRLDAPVAGAVLAVAEASPVPREQLALGDRPEQLDALDAVLTRLAARLGGGALLMAAPLDAHRPERAYGAAEFTGRKRRCSAAPQRGSRKAPSPRPAAAPEGACARSASGRRLRQQSTSGAAPPTPRPCPGGEGGDSTGDSASPPAGELPRPTRLLPQPQPLVALGEGSRLAAVRLGGRALRVLALSPVERLGGEWWSQPFDREYHRAELEGLGACWIYRDVADGRLWLHGFFD